MYEVKEAGMSVTRMVITSSFISALVASVILVVCFIKVFPLVLESIIIRVSLEKAPEHIISYPAQLDWILGKNSQGEQFIRRVPFKSKEVILEPGEEVYFEISMVLTREVSRDKVTEMFVNYMGEKSKLFVLSNCIDCKFVLKDWMETMKKEDFDFYKMK